MAEGKLLKEKGLFLPFHQKIKKSFENQTSVHLF